MGSSLYDILTIVMIAEFIFGNVTNGFIVLTNCIAWLSKRTLSFIGWIQLFLAISRVVLIWEMLLAWLKYMKYSFSYLAGTELRVMMLTWVVSNHFSLWLATILSIFYLLKIASFSRPVFLYLKWRVKKVLLLILLGNLIFLMFNILQINTHIEDWMDQYKRNITWDSRVNEFVGFSNLVLLEMIMFSVTPFTVALVSFILLIFSLWKHLQKMHLSSRGERDPSTKAHVNALRIMVSFLLLYATYFISFFISLIPMAHKKGLDLMFSLTVGLFYPSSHSFILILGHSNLRHSSCLVITYLRCKEKD
ncbi:taste receptor, type 2, member 7 [Rattus norvegicus]|uniref:Taste receptor type 2 member 13 n=2 Tax=Rattus norvegicus TaxID=10116 RepID=T2R13_RAT|nr:taste receptor type 2 member 13 [Rattus norvegicus]Q9JKT7.1 RecName: Full=Taste receptor type 2 member 13; Short=T2R13; AltName: Full=Taste receptor type 2 member 7; Short=T2R7 [Rattus norvegicus]AAF43917.1 candidate taste receptor T2R7 [Rattus norvegicus]EDM01678.1 taste receptor, type 2, member 7 [Rattus norvegicus]|eukprot:NP_076487.1 taste receptor type 2 member 13 [Rattus norvegicus]